MTIIDINRSAIELPSFSDLKIKGGDSRAFIEKFNAQQDRLGTLGPIFAQIAAAMVTVSGSVDFTGISTTSNTIAVGVKTFTVESGKGFVAGQGVKAASTVTPSTHYMSGTVQSYNSQNGELILNVTLAEGAGVIDSWNLSLAFDALVPNPAARNDGDILMVEGEKLIYKAFEAPAGSFVDFVVLTSGTTFQVPEGVSFAVIVLQSGGKGGSRGHNYLSYGRSGSCGNYSRFKASLKDVDTITYSIGVGGAAATTAGGYGSDGGTTSITIEGVTVNAGGSNGLNIASPTPSPGDGGNGSKGVSDTPSVLGAIGKGGAGGPDSYAFAGGAGAIILELYS